MPKASSGFTLHLLENVSIDPTPLLESYVPPAACPYDAPPGQWVLVINNNSGKDMNITIDDSPVTLKTGLNLIYLTADEDHQIKIGTNTYNFNAPECTTNTLNIN